MSKLYLQEKSSDGAEYARPPAFNPDIAVGFETFLPPGSQLQPPQFSSNCGGASLNDTSNLPPPPSYEEALAAPSATPPPIVISSGQNEEAEETIDDFCTNFCSEPGSSGCIAAWLVCSCISGGLGIIIGMWVIGALFYHDCPTQPEIPPLLIIGGAVIFMAIFVMCYCIGTKPTNNNEGNVEENPPKCIRSKLCTLFIILVLIWLGLYTFWVLKAYKPSFHYADANYCHPVLYIFSVVVLVVSYLALAIILKC